MPCLLKQTSIFLNKIMDFDKIQVAKDKEESCSLILI
jgi:hypothetical protein